MVVSLKPERLKRYKDVALLLVKYGRSDLVEPFPFAEVDLIVSGELGVRLSKAFADLERQPLAAASLAQVHLARMRDGRTAVVKVQRPNIREQIIEDLEALSQVAKFLDAHTELGKRYDFENMLKDLRASLLRELDFKLEANNLITFSENLREFEHIIIPEPKIGR